ncbi:hypothetical protein [Micromonospora mirobrigensis]|uniref:Secreted protein n=1 Tax=Micromonospora mirobrigensis TaxID=262898 RepID=A0A1C4U364_9ACTN|nr:hypothetical protein [Micromonospora mirobrigensis]SCE66153.1 hypothetical protein GA0070564_101195 [Micromonospora mirobrigensis]
MTTFSRRKVTALAVGVLALTLAGGGIAVAQPGTRAPQGSVQPAVRQPGNSGQPAVSAADARAAKAAMSQRIGITSTGPGTVAWAVVSDAGVLLRGSPDVVSAKRYGTGQYQVLFNYNVSGKSYGATVGTTDALNVPPGGEASVAPRRGTPNGVFVQTRTSTGGVGNRPFHLVVHN